MWNENVAMTVPDMPIHIGNERRVGKGVKCGFHFHDEIELLLVTEGSMTVTVGDRNYIVKTGETVFVSGRIPHATEYLDETNNSVLVQFRVEDFLPQGAAGDFLYFLNMVNETVVLFKAGSEICCCMERISAEYFVKESGYEMLLRSEVYRILGYFYRNGILTDNTALIDSKKIEKVAPVLRYIAENYAEPLTLQEISRMMNFDHSYFCRLFKKVTGRTFTEYLNFVRICKSEELLAHAENSITDVALEVGFSSASYFHRIFYRYKNCSPSVYRKVKYRSKR